MLCILSRFSNPLLSVITRNTKVCEEVRKLSTVHSTAKVKLTGAKLTNRCVICLSGTETPQLLQGLLTNNVDHLEENAQNRVNLPCIYTMSLNVQGRVLYDLFLYKLKNSEFLLDCDDSVHLNLIQHLKMYRLRKKVSISSKNQWSVWTVFNADEDSASSANKDGKVLDEHGLPLGGSEPVTSAPNMHTTDDLVIGVKDPRLADLGHRLVLNAGCSATEVFPDARLSENTEYTKLRYKLGVGEGVKDHPPGACFPLECNLEYLHGISFHKGCYVGQELTARTYYTGVVRKRLMPVKIDADADLSKAPVDCIVENEQGKNVGKFRNSEERYGLALLRVEESLNSKELRVRGSDIKLSVNKPYWWPQTLSKRE
ncbi:putative transferase CAF17 homolog, mitochondrial [Limulus polyphemus]|uniref:Transferase CAF17 homolog, mitochondrial n=1 Tax=Limulus polyphemus TaxID=6850 RepID=A0ABM1BIR0_LIMPO|nr:putative transferase CAF17 homolog, mitochondrial [Limulus polyphemus]XP_022250848.1 putative transferase CAF17 homolog, mitochondrial [Limulus polyphemus]